MSPPTPGPPRWINALAFWATVIALALEIIEGHIVPALILALGVLVLPFAWGFLDGYRDDEEV